mgnify:FL=1
MIHKPEIKILKNKEEIAFLFKDGIVTSNSIIKLIYSKKPGENYFHYTVSVPKKNFKKAVDRNKLKRLMRESVRDYYKINSPVLYPFNTSFFIFIGDTMKSYKEIKASIFHIINRVV